MSNSIQHSLIFKDNNWHWFLLANQTYIHYIKHKTVPLLNTHHSCIQSYCMKLKSMGGRTHTNVCAHIHACTFRLCHDDCVAMEICRLLNPALYLSVSFISFLPSFLFSFPSLPLHPSFLLSPLTAIHAFMLLFILISNAKVQKDFAIMHEHEVGSILTLTYSHWHNRRWSETKRKSNLNCLILNLNRQIWLSM